MKHCKHCLRVVDQRPEKAIGDGEVQMVWADPDDNWVCEVNGEEHEPVDGPAFVFTSVDPFIEAGRGEAYHFTFKGEDYYVEDWSTHNSDGEDLYDVATGSSINHVDLFDNDQQLTAFDEALEEAKGIWTSVYEDILSPAFEKAQAEYAKVAGMIAS